MNHEYQSIMESMADIKLVTDSLTMASAYLIVSTREFLDNKTPDTDMYAQNLETMADCIKCASEILEKIITIVKQTKQRETSAESFCKKLWDSITGRN